MGKCRDCSVCTRLGIESVLIFPFELLYKLTLGWNIGLIFRLFFHYCPQCGHRMSQHQKLADGSFKD